MRNPLAVARGTGSAHGGTSHWLLQRATALSLIPLGLTAAVLFFWAMSTGYHSAVALIREPWVLLFVVLLVAIPFWHGYLGLKVVLEDYISNKLMAYFAITLVRFFSIAVALLGILAALKVGLGG